MFKFKNKDPNVVPLFRRGDIGGATFAIAGNIINYIIVIAMLTNVCNWPDYIIYGRVIPGLSIGLMAGGLYYAWMGYRLSKKEGHPNVTALPSGVSTPSMFVILYGVVLPLHYNINDPELEWAAGVAACFIGGFVEFCGGFVGPWIKKQLPRAALLGTVAGIGFIWMSTQGIFDVFGDPLIGLPILLISMLGLFAGYVFPKKIPPFVVAIVGGIIYALILGRTSIDLSNIGFYFPNPVTTIQALFNGLSLIVPYLTIIIPIEIYNFIETMDNVEAANAAGDNYSVRQAQFADGIFTMISAIFGGVVPDTVWLGHPGLKRSEAGIGYSIVAGLVFGAAGIFGLFSFLNSLLPNAICGVTYLWCATVMVAQAFKESKVKHYAAAAIAMVPAVADYLYTQITGAMGYADVWTEIFPSGLEDFTPEVARFLIDNGVMWNGVPVVKAGAIIIGLLLGSIVAFLIDRRLDKAAVVCLVCAVLSFFGFIHHAALGFYYTSPFVYAYLITAVILFILHQGRKSWFTAPEDFEYV